MYLFIYIYVYIYLYMRVREIRAKMLTDKEFSKPKATNGRALACFCACH